MTWTSAGPDARCAFLGDASGGADQAANGQGKRRIAVGSGTSVQEVNLLLKQHREMQEMMKQIGKGGRGRNALSQLLGGKM